VWYLIWGWRHLAALFCWISAFNDQDHTSRCQNVSRVTWRQCSKGHGLHYRRWRSDEPEPGVAFSLAVKPESQMWEPKDDLPACSDPFGLDRGERSVRFPMFHGGQNVLWERASPNREGNRSVNHLKHQRDQVSPTLLKGVLGDRGGDAMNEHDVCHRIAHRDVDSRGPTRETRGSLRWIARRWWRGIRIWTTGLFPGAQVARGATWASPVTERDSRWQRKANDHIKTQNRPKETQLVNWKMNKLSTKRHKKTNERWRERPQRERKPRWRDTKRPQRDGKWLQRKYKKS